MLKANDANIKATKLIIEKITLAVANNPELAAGAARLLEGQTNLTKSLRSLTTLSVIEISDKPQGAYISEDGKKSSNTPEKGYVLNRDHPHFEEAEDYADEKMHYRPTPGDLVIFPGYLEHEFVVDHGIDPFRFIHFNIQAVSKEIVKDV